MSKRIIIAGSAVALLTLGASGCSQAPADIAVAPSSLPNVEVHAAYPVIASSPADLIKVSDVALVRRKGLERMIGQPGKRLAEDPRSPVVETYEQDFEVVRSFSDNLKAGTTIQVRRIWRNYSGIANVVHTDDLPAWTDEVYMMGLHDIDGSRKRFSPVGGPNGVIAFGGYSNVPVLEQRNSLVVKSLPAVDDTALVRGREGHTLGAILQEFESGSTYMAPAPKSDEPHPSGVPSTVQGR